MSKVITIPAQSFPSQKVEVVLREPLFSDQMEASRRHPGRNERVGYSQQELLCALCIEAINGAKVYNPTDPMTAMGELAHEDAQYLMAVFLATFTLDEELDNYAKTLADRVRDGGKRVCTIGLKEMPSGERAVSFSLPSLGDRVAVERRYPGEDSNCGYSFEHLFLAHRLETINGEALPKVKEPIDLLRDWPLLDLQFTLAVFLKCAAIDNSKWDDAKAMGKDFRSSLYGKKAPATTVSTKPATSVPDSSESVASSAPSQATTTTSTSS